MLDVHPPEHAAHSWRDFFIHIATICVGLLIAVALEQSVEALHRHHEAAGLREELRGESDQVLKDCRRSQAGVVRQLKWNDDRIQQVKATVWDHQPLPPLAEHPTVLFAAPDMPIWRSAKAGALTPLLSEAEINAYSEVEYVQMHVDLLATDEAKAQQALDDFLDQYPELPHHLPDLSKASLQDLRNYLTLLTALSEAQSTYLNWTRIMTGAEVAINEGKTNLAEITQAENQALHIPSN